MNIHDIILFKKGDEMLLLLIALLIIRFLLTSYVREKYNIIRGSHSYPPINNTHKWVNRLLLILFIVSILLAFFVNPLFVYVFSLVIVIYPVFNAFMEYKHEKEEKEYIVTSINALLVIFLVIGVSSFHYINNIKEETTWGELITEKFGDRPVEEISIETPDFYTRVKITDEQTIKNILEGPAKTKLIEADVYRPYDRKYLVIFGGGVYMHLSENLITFDGRIISYEADDDSVFRVIHEAFITNNN